MLNTFPCLCFLVKTKTFTVAYLYLIFLNAKNQNLNIIFLGFTGILNILYFYKVNLPPNLDYASAFIAFGMEGLLFANHLHGRSHMDVMVSYLTNF